ncbi:MAG: class I SAM-dependent methyltransferase [Candidatus Merdivicinus sp.]|jgi:2-polyprenyl-3-methyl-5-hydroxy-6-metoxy-1,4-benzoquinol methylase
MKENIYDHERFFQKYSQMMRSQKGLQGAGEWSELQKMLPDFCGKKVLDLGCGYGWHCKYAADNNAISVIGIDISQKMLQTAQKINSAPQIDYRCIAMEDLHFPEQTFDVILSSLAFHYIQDYESLMKNIGNWIKQGGSLVFSVEHPVFTSYGTQDWYYDETGKILHFPVDNYYYEGRREAIFLGEKVIKYHRTLTTYLNTLLQTGFELQRIIEPQPPKEMMHLDGMKDEMRRPMMLLVSATKK